MATLNAKIQIKHRTALEFTTLNEVLLLGEPALETDTLKEKIGNGVDAWNDLPYRSSGGSSGSSEYALQELGVDLWSGDTANTSTEIEDEINRVGFTITANTNNIFWIGVIRLKGDGIAFVRESYSFKYNNVAGVYGDSGTAVSLDDFYFRSEIDAGVYIPTGSEIVNLGEIGSTPIYTYINDLDTSGETWETLTDDKDWYFQATASGVLKLYKYVGSLPVTVGDGNTELDATDFDLQDTDTPTETGGGIPTVEQAGTTVIKTDKQYISEGVNAITQTDVLSFTSDLTNAIINGGGYTIVNSNGSEWLFDAGFNDFSIGGLTLMSNKIIPDADTKYRLVFFYTGATIGVIVSEVQELIYIPQLSAPILTDVSEGSNSQELDITFTDTNSSPNESGIEVYYRETSVGGAWTLAETLSADETTATINTGLDDTEFDISLIAIGSTGIANNSVRSNILTGTTANVVTPLFIDTFDGTSLDTSKWTLGDTSGAFSVDDGAKWVEPAPATGGIAFIDTNGKFERDLMGVTTVFRVDISRNTATPPTFFAFRLWNEGGNNRNIVIRNDSSTGTDKAEVFINSGPGGTDTVLSSKTFTGKFKIYVSDTGTAYVYKWDDVDTWDLLHSQPIEDNTYYIQIKQDETDASYTLNDTTIVTKVAVYDVDFATLNP